MLPYYNPYHNLMSMQATISQFELEFTVLKSQLKTQELETQKANSKFEFSISEQEKLKKIFESEKQASVDERASLVTRAETAEASLVEAKTELSSLKRQISQMVSAIFGKLLYINLKYCNPSFNDYCNHYLRLTFIFANT